MDKAKEDMAKETEDIVKDMDKDMKKYMEDI